MPFQGTLARARASGTASNFSSPGKGSIGYATSTTATRRHEFTGAIPSVGTPNAMGANTYFIQDLLTFARTFDVANPDVLPTATASNNFQSFQVMNGSYCQNMNTIMRIKNNSIATIYLDVYEIAISFFDGLVWNSVYTANCPKQFLTSANQQGEISNKIVSGTLVNSNTYASFKQLQHYMRKVGTITLSGQDTGNNTVEVNVTEIPAKCRRSQTGMNFAYLYHNDILKNGSSTINLSYEVDCNFDEIPSDIRQPYLY